jgi:hypothetical protein
MPPPKGFKIEIPVVHKLCELYKNLYLLSSKISKRDKFGIWTKIENICLEIISLTIAAALEPSADKLPILNSVRIKIEILKRLIRICKDLNVLTDKNYISTESDLQEISKMTNGWIKYLLKKSQ